jgi:beta-barrel assembly-enhancing protease
MKKLLNLIVLMIICVGAKSQFTLNLKGTETKTGKQILLKEISAQNDLWYAFIESDGAKKSIGFNELKRYTFNVSNIKEFWQNQALQNEVYESLTKYGMQYNLRREWEDEALKYLNELEQNNLFFNDSYLENYLYTVVYKLYPGSLNDGRPGIVNVKIMLDNSPNAFIFTNGTMILTTGLLSTINSEEELGAAMAHEIAHFVLDHSTININKAIQRQKNAEFWAAFATTLAAVSEVYVASQNEYYVPGALTYNTAILSFSIANAFTERLGLKYSREQELAADKCAVELLKFNGIDHTALSSVLQKIKDYCIISGNYFALSGSGTHPNISSRIASIGLPSQFNSLTYDRLISFVISTNAINEYNNKHFEACINLINRNIKAGVPTEDDYLLLAMTNLCLYDNEEKNKENLDLINKAKNLNVVPSINLYKQEALALIRLKRNSEAITSLQNYKSQLEEEYKKFENIKNESLWRMNIQYFDKELAWTNKMAYKIKNS